MGQIICRCGGRISTTGIPCKHEHVLIADTAHEKLVDQIMEIVEEGIDPWARISFLLLTVGPSVYKCPSCQGLLVFWDESKSPTRYMPDAT